MVAAKPDFETDVLVVGTGPMGATTALALATYGVRVHAISRENWLANSPRAHVANLRAMEVLRALGVEEDVRRQATPWQHMGDTMVTTSLTGPEIVRLRTYGTGDDRVGDYRRASPSEMADIPQPLLEPILVNAAAARGAHFSFNTSYLASEQDASGVTATLEDRVTSRRYTVRARYLVGADGARSRVAADADLPIDGVMGRAGTVYAQFEGDLSHLMAHRPSVLTWIANDAASVGEIGLGLLRAVRPWDRWIAGWGFDMATGDPDLSHIRARDRIRAYVGDPDFEPRITAVNPWFVNQAHASEYSNGRIFCGGDATHRHPPSNGLGSNTSIQDAFNLAWKLAFVLQGHAGPELLDSYSQERAPVGHQIVARANQSRQEFEPLKKVLSARGGTVADAVARLTASTPEGAQARAALAPAIAIKNYEFNALGVEMNQFYTSSAVLADPGDPATQRDESGTLDAQLHSLPSTRPGSKIPHAWLVGRNGRRVSTLDIVGDGMFTLLTGPSGTGWVEATESLGHPKLRAVVIGSPDAQDLYLEWQRLREIDEDGAILVRPDGTIAWRSSHIGADAAPALARALSAILASPVLTTASP